MPSRGVVNNPDGENGTSYFSGFGPETAYGAVKRLTQLTQAAPIQQPPRPRRRQQPTQPQPPSMPEPQLSPRAQVAAVWQALAADPDASDLVREYAARAGGGTV